MGLENIIESFAGQASAHANHAKVAGGLMQEIESRQGGLSGIMQSLLHNGMGQTVDRWSRGQTQPASSSDLEKGLAGTGLIDSVAQRTGLSPAVVQEGLAVVLPFVIHHMVAHHHIAADGQPAGVPADSGDVLQSVLQKIL